MVNPQSEGQKDGSGVWALFQVTGCKYSLDKYSNEEPVSLPTIITPLTNTIIFGFDSVWTD